MPVEQVIAHNIGELFRGMEVVGVHPFRITRNADIRRDEEEADDLIEMVRSLTSQEKEPMRDVFPTQNPEAAENRTK